MILSKSELNKCFYLVDKYQILTTEEVETFDLLMKTILFIVSLFEIHDMHDP